MKKVEKLIKVLKEGVVPIEKCFKCGKKIEIPLYIDRKPYHSKCASTLYEEKK